MILTAYMDESGTHGDAPVMVVSGWVGRLGQWQAFDKKWRAHLSREGVDHYHTKSLRSRIGPFKGWDDARAQKFADRAYRIADRNTLCGFAMTLKHEDYEKYYVAGERPKRIPLDTKYGLAFRVFLSFIPEMVQSSFPGNPIQMHIVQEAGGEGMGDCGRILTDFHRFAPPELAEMVVDVTTAPKRRYPGLEAADMISGGAYQREQKEDVGLVNFPRKGGTLDEAGAQIPYRSPVFRLEATPAVLTELKESIISRIAIQKAYGVARRRGPTSDPDASPAAGSGDAA